MRERFDLRSAAPTLRGLLVGLVAFGIGVALMVASGLGLWTNSLEWACQSKRIASRHRRILQVRG